MKTRIVGFFEWSVLALMLAVFILGAPHSLACLVLAVVFVPLTGFILWAGWLAREDGESLRHACHRFVRLVEQENNASS